MGVWNPGPGATVGNDVFVGGAANDSVNGLEGDDQLNGGGGDDFLDAGGGMDILRGGAGDDVLWGGIGATFDGGPGFDRMQTGVYSAGVLTVDMRVLDAGADLYLSDGQIIKPNIEAIMLTLDVGAATVFGSSRIDYLTIIAQGDNVVRGGSGNDTIASQGMIDKLYGQDGDDLITAEKDSHHDELVGAAGDDQLVGSLGDHFNGGAGQDEVLLQLLDSMSGVHVDFSNVSPNGELPYGTSFRGIENVFVGIYDDQPDFQLFFTGHQGVDTVLGGALDDIVRGDDGDDDICGGLGADRLSGGGGTITCLATSQVQQVATIYWMAAPAWTPWLVAWAMTY